MNINKVTITGADDKTNIKDLVKLSEEFPFVEWGILFSASKPGSNRYPTKGKRDQFAAAGLNLSAHFCGHYSSQVIENSCFDEIDNLDYHYNRVQLNYNFTVNNGAFDYQCIKKLMRYIEGCDNRSIIIQHNKANAKVVLLILHTEVIPDMHFLYDSSGGRGVGIKTIHPPLPVSYTGYSGGIAEYNIDSICQKIAGATHHIFNAERKVWIDMESGVRTNDELDIAKVRYVLEHVKNYFNL